ncbi:MAG: hypothetical protein LBQ93_08875 [Treponema sp.]|nr:hypothetical protein [Treponema sp.]
MKQAVKLLFLLLIMLLTNGCQRKTGAPDQFQNETVISDEIETYEEAGQGQYQKEPIKDNSPDPFLLFFFRNYPTIKADTSANVVTQRISYKNFDQKEIILSDDPDETYYVFLFRNGEFCGIDYVIIDQGEMTRTKSTEIIHNSDGTIAVTYYQGLTNRISNQHIFNWNDNILIANDGNRDGRPISVLVKNEIGYMYFYSHENYGLNLPSIQIEFIDNETIIYINSTLNPLGTISKSYYENGILMKIEHRNGRTETYTVSSGKGEVIVTDDAGEVKERHMLERRINEAGYLEYEAVKRLSGTGYEYFFTKDTF